MNMGHGQYEDFEEFISKLKQIKQRLEEENQQLRQQLAQSQQELANLRRGIGITVTIDGKTILTGTPPPLPDVILPVSANGPPIYSPPVVSAHLQRQHPVQTLGGTSDTVSPTAPNLFGNRHAAPADTPRREQEQPSSVPNPNFFL